jgi:NAD(P)-dependent dehydrogenase (short-subunit alcohol dehydrogenase family)
VAVADIDGDRANELASKLDGSIGLQADVADEASVAAAVDQAYTTLGRIDSVLNAAGHHAASPVEDWSYQEWLRLMSVHAGGTFLVCKHVVPRLRDQGGGSIVNITSIAALVAQPENSAYGAAKGAILSFSRQLAMELAPSIRVNAVAPGRVRTGMTMPLYEKIGEGSFERGIAIAGSHNPQARVAEAEEIAAPICFLLSDDASFVTGSLTVVDGGETVV